MSEKTGCGAGLCRGGDPSGRRTTTYCVIPSDLATELHESLRAHFADDRSVVVVVERRRRQRRKTDRRTEGGARSNAERRKIRSDAGRRVGDRRSPGGRTQVPDLPPRVAPYAQRLVFVRRSESTDRHVEDLEANRLVVRIQRGDPRAFDDLYLRYFDRVYAYARVALRDAHEAEDIAQLVFANVIQALPRFEVRADTPFRAWLFRITRNAVLRAVARSGRVQFEEPTELERRLESPGPAPLAGLDWLSDADLAVLVERLPLPQRQVVLLRYMLELTTGEIATALGRSEGAIRLLEHRAMRGLERRLEALRGGSTAPSRSPMQARRRTMPVLSARRVALTGGGRIVPRPLARPVHRYR